MDLWLGFQPFPTINPYGWQECVRRLDEFKTQERWTSSYVPLHVFRSKVLELYGVNHHLWGYLEGLGTYVYTYIYIHMYICIYIYTPVYMIFVYLFKKIETRYVDICRLYLKHRYDTFQTDWSRNRSISVINQSIQWYLPTSVVSCFDKHESSWIHIPCLEHIIIPTCWPTNLNSQNHFSDCADGWHNFSPDGLMVRWLPFFWGIYFQKRLWGTYGSSPWFTWFMMKAPQLCSWSVRPAKLLRVIFLIMKSIWHPLLLNEIIWTVFKTPVGWWL